MPRSSAQGVKLDVDRLGEIAGDGRASEVDELEREIWELAGEEFTIGSPQQLGDDPVREARPVAEAPRQDRLLDRRARARRRSATSTRSSRRSSAGASCRSSSSTYLDALPRLIDARDGRLHTTFNQTATTTGRLSSTNPNLQNIPIRTELGPRDPQLLHRRGRHQADLGRLLAGRAADPRPHRRRGGAEARSSSAARTCTPRPRPRSSKLRAGGDRPGRCARRRRWSTSGSSTGCQRYGLADRLEHPAGGGGRVHRALPRPLPAGAGSSSSRRSRRPPTRRLRDARCSAAAAQIPELRSRKLPDALAGRAPGGQHGRSRAPPRTSSRSRWCAADARAARRGPATRLVLRSTTSCCSRGPTSEVERGDGDRRGGDGGRVRARPAAGGRRRRGRQLARGEVRHRS